MYITHCSECGTPLEEDEIAFHETGSLTSTPTDLCEYCSTLHGLNDKQVGLDDFLDEVEYINDLDENDWDDEN